MVDNYTNYKTSFGWFFIIHSLQIPKPHLLLNLEKNQLIMSLNKQDNFYVSLSKYQLYIVQCLILLFTLLLKNYILIAFTRLFLYN